MLPTPDVLATELAKESAPHIGRLLLRIGRKSFNKFIALSTNIFSQHLQDTKSRCSVTKNILYKNPVPLQTQYVQNYFKFNNKILSDIEVLENAKTKSISYLITGSAGSGKSIFMKWLAVSLCDSILHHQKIPLFIEARSLDVDILQLSFEEMIFRSTSTEKSQSTLEQVTIGLEAGVFVVMLDGLDEISPDHRSKFLGELASFRRRFPDCSVMCSSRPEHLIESLADLSVLRISQMSLMQINELIGNLVYDADKKSIFLKELNDSLYDIHKSFLSNPLLAIIMLITFDENANIPRKLSYFYSNVFEALFSRHDTSKGAYIRDHYAKLEIDKFEEAFRSFCFESYAIAQLSFSDTDLTRLVRSSLKRSAMPEIKPRLFINDLKESVCLMQENGLETSFTHRSFQEYFAARYLLYYKGSKFPDILDHVSYRYLTDNVLTMLFQMNAIEVKRLWMLPRLNSFIKLIDTVDASDTEQTFEFLSSIFIYLTINEETRITSLTYERNSPAVQISAVLHLLAPEMELDDEMLLSGKIFGEEGQTFNEFIDQNDLRDSDLGLEIVRLVPIKNRPAIYFNRHIESWMPVSNLGRLTDKLRSRAHSAKEFIESQTSESDDFANDILKLMDR